MRVLFSETEIHRYGHTRILNKKNQRIICLLVLQVHPL